MKKKSTYFVYTNVADRVRKTAKCAKMKNARVKRAKLLLSLLKVQICDVLVAVVVVVT